VKGSEEFDTPIIKQVEANFKKTDFWLH